MLRLIPLLFLSGCSFGLPFLKEPGQFACVQVYWTETPEKRCGVGKVACATVGDGLNLQHLFAPKPRAFDDYDRVCALGHEFLHSLGAQHP
jgi:hypothetical protein